MVNALIDGTQTVLVRHPTLDPGTIDAGFVLYPAYTHQEPDRYQPRYEDYYYRASAKPEKGVPVRGVAEVREELVVSSASDGLEVLANHYVYTPDGLCDKYDPDDDLRVLLLRVAELELPQIIEERGSYRGCRAWIELAEDVTIDRESATPVLSDAAFVEREAAVRDAPSRPSNQNGAVNWDSSRSRERSVSAATANPTIPTPTRAQRQIDRGDSSPVRVRRNVDIVSGSTTMDLYFDPAAGLVSILSPVGCSPTAPIAASVSRVRRGPLRRR